jgi:ATP-dependent RNA helicase DDX31/DBP7
LHLGHLAKAFALREAPRAVTKKTPGGSTSKSDKHAAPAKAKGKGKAAFNVLPVGKEREREWQETYDPETEARMSKAVREQGRLSKKQGKLVSTGTSEFQIASGDVLEAMVRVK